MTAKRLAKPTPRCKTCPRPLDPRDVRNKCVRCDACRKGTGRFVSLQPEKPVNLRSWWVDDQSRTHEGKWFTRARGEAARMLDSPEAKKLGYRKAVDELVGMRRAPVHA